MEADESKKVAVRIAEVEMRLKTEQSHRSKRARIYKELESEVS